MVKSKCSGSVKRTVCHTNEISLNGLGFYCTDCQSAACEMYPQGIDNPTIHEGYNMQFKWMESKTSQSSPYRKSNLDAAITDRYLSDECRRWNGLIGQYSRRSLTQAQDKLVAISGVARKIEQRMQAPTHDKYSGYLAGLWGEFLPVQLLWYTALGEQCTRTQDYRAPSVGSECYDCRNDSKISVKASSSFHQDVITHSPCSHNRSNKFS